jgi:hypothetical protein
VSFLTFTPGAARARLATLPAVTIFDRVMPHDPAEVAFVTCGIRCYVIRKENGGFSAAYHLRLGEYLPLAEEATEDTAFATVAEHIRRIGHLPAWWSAKTDNAERTAAAEILASFAAPLSLVTWESVAC